MLPDESITHTDRREQALTADRFNSIKNTYMKLAETLQIRADLQRRLAQMPSRLRNNATIQEGSSPTESPDELIHQTDSLLMQLEKLMNRINMTNSIAKDEQGNTITALIARRDTLRKKSEILRNFLEAASDITPRHSSTDIRILSTVNVPELRKQCDDISKELRQTDIRIQQLNWTTELE